MNGIGSVLVATEMELRECMNFQVRGGAKLCPRESPGVRELVHQGCTEATLCRCAGRAEIAEVDVDVKFP